MGVDFAPYHKSNPSKPMQKDRPFVAWDTEGVTHPGDRRQSLVLLANSVGHYRASRCLSTEECLELIMDTEREDPNVIHVGFSFGYDVEMILRDVDLRRLAILHEKGAMYWRRYRIEYKRGKWFQVTKKFGTEKVTARIYDVWGFFQSSFLAAVKDNLGEIPELAAIEAGKSGRSLFTYDELDNFIIPYCQAECRITVQMMTTLRERLYAADLKILQWHGPGAIASFAYTQRKVAPYMDHDIPEPVNRAAQYAYAGGRFELFKVGRHVGNVYRYDIRSAYPSAIVELPGLADGVWTHVTNPDPTKLARFGVYRIEYADPNVFGTRPQPFYYRDPRYAIHFPNAVQGWYWTPEAEFVQHLKGKARILEGWEFSENGSRPFAWVDEVYETRAQWKREGNASQMALKLLLNSLYGKMAQRVGWEQSGKAPKWHQLEWAGYVTSRTRAKLYLAMLQAHKKGALIGVETDGIFTSAPLTLDEGPHLGQWEADTFDGMAYLQSGFYFLQNGEKWTAKYRGFDKGSVSESSAIDVLNNWQPWNDEPGRILGTTTRFSTMGVYLRSKAGDADRNVWETTPRELVIGETGKRVHRPKFCRECQKEVSPGQAMHSTIVTYPIGGESLPHSLPWLHAKGEDPNPFRNGEQPND